MKRSYAKFVERITASGLHDVLEKRARQKRVSLRDLYEGPTRAPSIVLARRSIYTKLMDEGMGLNEVARLFDRMPSGVRKLVGAR